MKYLLPLFFCFAAFRAFATPAPNFTVTTSDNQALQLYQNFVNQGKVVVIEAFFTTCPPCNTHAPLMQNLYTQMLAAYPGKVEFILLSTLSSDLNTTVAQYKTSKGLTMPAVGSNGGSQTALQPYTSGQFGTFYGTPTFIVIAPNTGEVHFDIRGNSATATMTLLSDKIAELLPVPPPPAVFCNLRNYFDTDLQAVQIHAFTPTFDTTFLATGAFSLSNIPKLKNTNYTIKPHQNTNPLSGLTTYDLVLISKHILGIEALQCDWQRIAADVNCSGSITTFDIVLARKLILGIDNELPCGSWRFVPDSATAMNNNCVAFQGVKIGDVTAGPCAQFSPAVEDRAPWRFAINDRMMAAGETAKVTLNAIDGIPLQGMQGLVSFDYKMLNIKNIQSSQLPDFNTDNYNLNYQYPGIIPISWITPGMQEITPEMPVLTMEVTAKQSGKLSELLAFQSSPNLRSEAYDATGGIHPIELVWREATIDNRAQTTFAISPNPTQGQFTISTNTDQAETCLVDVFNAQGRLIAQKTFQAIIGTNYWSIDLERATPGLYFVRVNGKSAGKVLIQN